MRGVEGAVLMERVVAVPSQWAERTRIALNFIVVVISRPRAVSRA